VLQGHSDQKVSFSDFLFNLPLKETCVKVCVSVFQLWIVNAAASRKVEVPTQGCGRL